MWDDAFRSAARTELATESRPAAERSERACCAARQTSSAEVSSCSVCQTSVIVAARHCASRSRGADTQLVRKQVSRVRRIARIRLPPEGHTLYAAAPGASSDDTDPCALSPKEVEPPQQRSPHSRRPSASVPA